MNLARIDRLFGNKITHFIKNENHYFEFNIIEFDFYSFPVPLIFDNLTLKEVSSINNNFGMKYVVPH